MSNFKYSTILDFYKELIYKKEFMPNSMEIIHTILHPIFKNAVRDGLIRTNPTTGAMKEIKALKEWKEQPKRESLTTLHYLIKIYLPVFRMDDARFMQLLGEYLCF